MADSTAVARARGLGEPIPFYFKPPNRLFQTATRDGLPRGFVGLKTRPRTRPTGDGDDQVCLALPLPVHFIHY
jgi:hypothetical protein